MAQDNTFIPFITPMQKASGDFRQFQHKAVQIANGGFVYLASTDAGSGGIYFVANKPNSGEAVSLNHPPNVTKAWCVGSLLVGNHVTIETASGNCTVGSKGSACYVGIALTSAVSGSLFDLAMRA